MHGRPTRPSRQVRWPAAFATDPAQPGRPARQPRPANGIFVAITVWNMTLASSGRLAM